MLGRPNWVMIDGPLYFIHTLYTHTENRHVASLYPTKKKNLNRLLSSSPLPCLCLVDPSPPPATAAATSSSLFVFSPCFLSLSPCSFSLLVFSLSHRVHRVHYSGISSGTIPYLPIASDSPHAPQSTTTNTTVDLRTDLFVRGNGVVFFSGSVWVRRILDSGKQRLNLNPVTPWPTGSQIEHAGFFPHRRRLKEWWERRGMFEGVFHYCRGGLMRVCLLLRGGLGEWKHWKKKKQKRFAKLPKYPATWCAYKSGMGKRVFMNHFSTKFTKNTNNIWLGMYVIMWISCRVSICSNNIWRRRMDEEIYIR